MRVSLAPRALPPSRSRGWLGEGWRSDDPEDEGCTRHADHDGDLPQLVAQKVTMAMTATRAGKARARRRPIHNRVDRAAAVAGDHAEHAPERQPDRHRPEADDERDPGAVDDATQDVAAQVVDPNQWPALGPALAGWRSSGSSGLGNGKSAAKTARRIRGRSSHADQKNQPRCLRGPLTSVRTAPSPPTAAPAARVDTRWWPRWARRGQLTHSRHPRVDHGEQEVHDEVDDDHRDGDDQDDALDDDVVRLVDGGDELVAEAGDLGSTRRRRSPR